MKQLFAITLTSFSLSLAHAAERPNIVWLTSEDNSAHWLGCYGNKMANTPNLDKLASSGIQYNHAYSNGAVCAVAPNTSTRRVTSASVADTSTPPARGCEPREVGAPVTGRGGREEGANKLGE